MINILFCVGVPLPGRENEEDDIFNCRINEKKLHEYPGFNAPFPSDCIDVSSTMYLIS